MAVEFVMQIFFMQKDSVIKLFSVYNITGQTKKYP